MLLYLTQYLTQFESAFNVFNYPTLRAILGALTALVLSFVIGPRMIAKLSLNQSGQPVREYGPSSHLPKAGTPTMGGALILTSIVISTVLWADLKNPFVWVVLFVTLAFGEIIRLVLLNWQAFTGGPNGVSGIPRPSFFGLPFNADENGFAAYFGIEFNPSHRVVFLFYIILALALVTNLVTLRLRRLPIGRAWEAMREDEIACRSLGINTTNTKLTAFALGALFGGIAGAFFATRQGFISPESFTFMESAMIVAIVVLGGMGSQLGVALSAVIMVGGFELFREFEQYRMLIFGLAMVAIMVWRPRGLIAKRDPSIYLRRAKPISEDKLDEARR